MTAQESAFESTLFIAFKPMFDSIEENDISSTYGYYEVPAGKMAFYRSGGGWSKEAYRAGDLIYVSPEQEKGKWLRYVIGWSTKKTKRHIKVLLLRQEVELIVRVEHPISLQEGEEYRLECKMTGRVMISEAGKLLSSVQGSGSLGRNKKLDEANEFLKKQIGEWIPKIFGPEKNISAPREVNKKRNVILTIDDLWSGDLDRIAEKFKESFNNVASEFGLSLHIHTCHRSYPPLLDEIALQFERARKEDEWLRQQCGNDVMKCIEFMSTMERDKLDAWQSQGFSELVTYLKHESALPEKEKLLLRQVLRSVIENPWLTLGERLQRLQEKQESRYLYIQKLVSSEINARKRV